MFPMPRHFAIILAKCSGVIFMVIYHDFKIGLEEYARLGKKNEFPSFDRCPCCKGMVRLYRHGYYWRNAIDVRSAEYRIPICRLICPSCQKTVSILPTFLIEYFQHTVDFIFKTLKMVLINRSKVSYRQLAQFYFRRLFKRLNQIEMYFRELGFRGVLPQAPKEKAIKLLEMILAPEKATFERRPTGHFPHNFMAH